MLTPGQSVLALTVQDQAPGRVVSRVSVVKKIPDEVNVSELPSMYQEVWSANFCQLPSQQKFQRRRVSSFGIGFKGTHISFLKFRMTFTLTTTTTTTTPPPKKKQQKKTKPKTLRVEFLSRPRFSVHRQKKPKNTYLSF